jgi:hypothetical protein
MLSPDENAQPDCDAKPTSPQQSANILKACSLDAPEWFATNGSNPLLEFSAWQPMI